MIQIDYSYTFTKQKHEIQEGEQVVQAQGPDGAADADNEPNDQEQPEAAAEQPVDYRDQFGLCMVAAESTTGWITCLPVLEKGAGSLKRVTEALVRLSLHVSPSEPVLVQGDPEPAVKQVLNATEACRGRLGLVTNTRLIEKGSHASNGQVEKAIDTIRRGSLTLRSYLEDKIRAKVSGHHHIFAWLGRHASFLYNRFSTGGRGAPPFEIMFGRRFKGRLLPFGEKCIFFRPSRHKGDLQWDRGLWIGINERNGAHILGTPAGVVESRSVRRLPDGEQWDAEMVVSMKGLPWCYGGTSRRKRPLYSSIGSRLPLLPDGATLEELAKAAGKAAAETIAAATPVPANARDEAGSDPPSSPTSSSTSSSGSPGAMPLPRSGAPATAAAAAGGGDQESRGDERRQRQHPNTHQESAGQPQPPERGDGSLGDERRQQQHPDTHQESAGQPQPPGASDMQDVSRPPAVRDEPPQGGATPKRARLLLDRPQGSPQSVPPAPPGQLYPPGYAGIAMVHGDVPPEELAGYDEWGEDLCETLAEESELAGELETWWDADGENPPELSEDELRLIDSEADRKEITRLIHMGVARWPAEGEDVSGYQVLTTKVVRDWRKRPGWLRRSRLVGREFRTMAAYTQELFAPASTLATVHMFISWALSKGLEITTIDVKDAYLNVPQPSPVTIQVERRMFGENAPGTVTLVLDKLLPGQRIGASAWYGYARDILHEAGLESFVKEPTLFRSKEEGNDTALILHADDGLLASTRAERAKFEATFGAKVTLQVAEPLLEVGDVISFLKRKYVKVPEGVNVYANSRYLESLSSALGPKVKPRDSPADNSFLEPDTSRDLGPADAKLYKESVGRLLYLAHSRPDVQFPVCILSSKMSAPTAMSMKWLHRVVGYLLATPEIGFAIKPLRNEACFSFEGKEQLVERDGGCFKVILESVTDADWGGCKRTRRSRSSMQYYVAGSLVGSAVRTQKAIALSSAESEFVAILGGACEALYLKDCLGYLAKGEVEIEIRCRSDSASARAISQRLGCGRVRHLHAGSLWIQGYVKRRELTVGPIAGALNPADVGTKPLAGPRIRELLFTMGAVAPGGDPYGQADKEAADEKRALSQALKNFTGAGAKVSNIKTMLPMLLMLTQVNGVQGLGLVTWEPEDWVLLAITAMVGAIAILVVFGLPYGVFKLLKWSLGKVFRGSKGGAAQEPQENVEPQTSSASKHVQASLGMSKGEKSFCEEYVSRCTEAESLLAQKCRENEQFEEALREARAECRRLQEVINRLRVRREPETIHVTTSRGTRFHLPGCGHIRNSQIRAYTACRDCFGG